MALQIPVAPLDCGSWPKPRSVCPSHARRRSGCRPSTKVLDLTEKRHVYAAAAVPAYWLVDPDAQTVTILELVDAEYVERAVLSGDDEVEVRAPFPMTLRPRHLFD